MKSNDQKTTTSTRSQPTTAAKETPPAYPIPLMPPGFDADYITGCVAPFFKGNMFITETPSLPMIDLALSKDKAINGFLFGLLYEGWDANPVEEGVTVFSQGYERRGPENERKRIYQSAVTPDLIDTKYRTKIDQFYKRFLAGSNAGTPLMQHYFDNYDDLYWDLHVGAKGNEIPNEVRQFSTSFSTVLGFYYPTLEIVRDNYKRARETRATLKSWLDERVQLFVDGKVANPDSTFVHYWLKNGGGENFRQIDLVFECYHNFLAFSQWANVIYNVAKRLEPTEGDATIRAWFDKTMKNGPDNNDGSPFTPLDRFTMELFRVINPNPGSGSTLVNMQQPLNSDQNLSITLHGAASMDPRHWENPAAFDPDRYRGAPISSDNAETRAKAARLARCPFSKGSFAVKDGRNVNLTNSGFGAVYSEIDGVPSPVVDTAGYAPFGFGYRRCPGEQLTVEFIKDFLRNVWRDQISFVKLDIKEPRKQPIGPMIVLDDNIGFRRGS
jgi:hypothetical protein